MGVVAVAAPVRIQANGSRLWLQVEDGAIALLCDPLERALEMGMAGAERRPEDVSDNTLAVDTHQSWGVGCEGADGQEHVLTTVDTAFIGNGAEDP